jgi:SAM-dependent methyltransferase
LGLAKDVVTRDDPSHGEVVLEGLQMALEDGIIPTIPKEIARLKQRSRRTVDHPAKKLNAVQRSARDRVLQRYLTSVYAVEDVPCVCGFSQGVSLVERDRYGLPTPSVLCVRCGVVRTTPTMIPESLALFYEEDYRPLYDGAEVAPDTFFAEQVNRGRGVYEFARPQGTFRRVADIGCGAGGTLLAFREAGGAVFGCDLGGTFLELGREHGLDLRHGSHETLVDAAPFDLVVLSHVIEHIPDPYAFLIDVKSLLTPTTGMIYVEVPGLREIGRYGDPLAYFQNAHLYNFDLGTLSRLFRSAGYDLVAGNEHVRALFIAGRPTEPLVVDPGAVGSVLESIATAERQRLRNQLKRAIELHTGGRASGALQKWRRRLKRAGARVCGRLGTR